MDGDHVVCSAEDGLGKGDVFARRRPVDDVGEGSELVNRALKLEVPEACGTPPSLDIRKLRDVRASAALDRHIQRAIVIQLQRRRSRLSRRVLLDEVYLDRRSWRRRERLVALG